MISDASGHCGCDSQRLVDFSEIVVHEVKGDHMAVIFQLFAETIGKPRKSPHRHAHCEVLALYE